MQKLFILGLAVFALVFTSSVQAKILPQSAKAGKTTISRSSGSTIGVFPRLRPDRRGLNVTFTNLGNAKSVSYMLIYTTSTQQEAASGALSLKGSTESVELLFATCSAGVCRYHTGIKDAKLEVSYTSKNGKKYLKKFKIRV